jgi:hypothetical protein
MRGLELSLQVLINLEGVTHFIINEEFVGDGKWDQEFGGVGLALQLTQPGYYPEQDVLNGALVTVHDVSHKVRVKIGRVSEDLQETAHSLLGLILWLLLHIHSLVLGV